MDQDDLLPVDTESGFAQAIREHLALKTRNAELDGDMPIDRTSTAIRWRTTRCSRARNRLGSRRRWTASRRPS